MAYYQISVTIHSTKEISVIRELEQDDIDKLFAKYFATARAKYRNLLIDFNIGMVSVRSPVVKRYLQTRQETSEDKKQKNESIDDYIRRVYRNDKSGRK